MNDAGVTTEYWARFITRTPQRLVLLLATIASCSHPSLPGLLPKRMFVQLRSAGIPFWLELFICIARISEKPFFVFTKYPINASRILSLIFQLLPKIYFRQHTTNFHHNLHFKSAPISSFSLHSVKSRQNSLSY